MSGFVEIAQAVFSASQQRLETISQNVNHMTSPGYQAKVSFQNVITRQSLSLLQAQEGNWTDGLMSTSIPMSPSGFTETGLPFDLALSGPGYFAVRQDDLTLYTRAGQFVRNEDGYLTDSNGFVLQDASGSDLIVRSSSAEILLDGVVLEDDLPIGRVGVFAPDSDQTLSYINGTRYWHAEDRLNEVEMPVLRQGMLESSNVELGYEMVQMTAALRQAEVGSRLLQSYDGLMGQVISTFSQKG
ncbi:flagellar hook basal-body protein [Woodsholea maritima]|uniref:flagellar hook basal-body protein n=1 Tax=Woodsholea maritima TaxID=240237 RepID=UPI00035FFCAA|nr:flagellar hook basal-body protein [Woodsholea maritima]